MLSRFQYPLVLATVVMGVSTTGCFTQSDPVNFQVSVPQPNVIGFQATLTQHYGIGLQGSFALPQDVGTIVLSPETSSQGFGLGFNLNTRAFMKDTWTDFRDVTALPTGAAFPSWMTGPVADVVIPPLNQYGVDYHFYIGDHGQYYLGAAGVIDAVDEHFPAVNIGYTFYDNKGNVVIGFQFFGPKIGSDGHAEVKGGIFIGTNLTPFLPREMQPGAPVVASSAALSSVGSAQMLELVNRANSGRPVQVNGVSVHSFVEARGPDAHRYQSQAAIRGLVDRYMAASRKTK